MFGEGQWRPATSELAVGTESVACWVEWSVHGQWELVFLLLEGVYSVLTVQKDRHVLTLRGRGDGRAVLYRCIVTAQGISGCCSIPPSGTDSPPARHGRVRSWLIFRAGDHEGEETVKLTLDLSD